MTVDRRFGSKTLIIPFTWARSQATPAGLGGMSRMRPAGSSYRNGGAAAAAGGGDRTAPAVRSAAPTSLRKD